MQLNCVCLLILIVIQFNYGYSRIVKDNHTQVIVTPQYLSRNTLFNFLYPTVNLTLEELISVEEDTWHFVPYKRIQYFVSKATGDCSETEIEQQEADTGLFTLDQLRSGAVILHFIGVAYFFTLLTVICNDYFLPSVECICEDLKLSADVAAATFMASATTTPEFFTNTISTFFTESDLGLGTIVGSLMFNTLGVAAIASLAAPHPVQLDWWPITRDSLLYSMNLSFLIVFAWDGAIFWYEALIMVCLYVTYFCIMFNSRRIMKFVKKYVEGKWNFCQRNRLDFEQQYPTTTISTIALPDEISKESHDSEKFNGNVEPEKVTNPVKQQKSLWRIPRETPFKTFWWFYVWPIKLVLTCTIPSPKTYRKLYPLSFVMCIIWIGCNAWSIVQLIVIVGITLDIPDSVMGLTFLAAGSCLPEAISAFIVTRKGLGGMGVSNSLGSNSLAILFSLGMPWFIKTMIDGGSNTKAFINIDSYGIEFIILSLLLTIACLYITIAIGGFQLKTLIGGILFSIYLVFITTAILVEMDVLFPTGNKC